LDMLVPEAKEYLKRLQAEIEGTGLKVSTSVSRSGPAKAITKTSKSTKSDLIVLATHGMKGSKPFWEGSITPKVIRSGKVPILLVPVRN
jgi:nucleotide-binding universal stress UspA family protein